jgi:hypothetical protein
VGQGGNEVVEEEGERPHAAEKAHLRARPGEVLGYVEGAEMSTRVPRE